MTSTDLKYIAENQPSICIPRVFDNIDEKRIRNIFNQLNIGIIRKIDIIFSYKSDKNVNFKRVFIHFDKWYNNPDANEARKKLISGKEIKIVYDNPWFWKVSASQCTYYEKKTNINTNHNLQNDAPKIIFDNDDNNDYTNNKIKNQNASNEFINSIYQPQHENRQYPQPHQQPEYTRQDARSQNITTNDRPTKKKNTTNIDKERVRLPSQGMTLNYGTEPLPMPKKRVVSKKVKKIIYKETKMDNQTDEVTITQANSVDDDDDLYADLDVIELDDDDLYAGLGVIEVDDDTANIIIYSTIRVNNLNKKCNRRRFAAIIFTFWGY